MASTSPTSTTTVNPDEKPGAATAATHKEANSTTSRTNNNNNNNNNQESQEKYILSFYVPTENTQEVCTQLCQQSNAGSYPGGLYTEAYWKASGRGQFRAMPGSNPAIGTAGKQEVEIVDEDKVEVLCLGWECVEKAVEVLRKVHPYEEVPYYVVKSLL